MTEDMERLCQATMLAHPDMTMKEVESVVRVVLTEMSKMDPVYSAIVEDILPEVAAEHWT